MTRYIDADALLQKWEERHRPNFHENTGAYFEYLQTYWAIKDAPTADVVEVVYCKDCLHRTELPYVDKETHEPIYDCGYNISPLWGEENGYCSHGERRE